MMAAARFAKCKVSVCRIALLPAPARIIHVHVMLREALTPSVHRLDREECRVLYSNPYDQQDTVLHAKYRAASSN